MRNSILIIIIVLSVHIKAQVIISTDSTYTSTSSKVSLDVNGKDGGVLLPRVVLNTLFPETDMPKEGTVVYNSLENTTDPLDSRLVGYYIFTNKKWRFLLDEERGLKYIPKRITYTKSTFNKNEEESTSLVLLPESYNDINPDIALSEDKSFEIGIQEEPYKKWKNIEDFNTKILIEQQYHKKNKLILAIDGPISFTNYSYGIATFAIGVFIHKLEEDRIIESKFIGARIYDMDLFEICTSNNRTPSFLIEDLEMGDYIVEPVYRLIYSHDYKGGYNQSSDDDRWEYDYAGVKDDDIRRTRMFIGAPEDTRHYYTFNNRGTILNYDGSARSRPPGECPNPTAFTYQSTIELIIYKKD